MEGRQKTFGPARQIIGDERLEIRQVALTALRQRHAKRAIDGIAHALRIVGVDLERGNAFMRGAGKARQDQHAGILGILRGDEVLRHQIHAVAQGRDQSGARGTIKSGECRAAMRFIDVTQRRPRGLAIVAVDPPHRLADLAAQFGIFGDAGPAARRNLQIGDFVLPVREITEEALERMDAFERFLGNFPDWQNKVTYLQITPRSRTGIPEYAELSRKVGEAVGRINGNYGEASWTPLRYINKAHSRTALAGLYRAARAALVTPLRDGMNLVAKEFIAAQDPEDPGVLILSRFAGAAHECVAALQVNPYDPEGVGNAINRALCMPLTERRERHLANFKTLVANDLSRWAERFLTTLHPPDAEDAAHPVVRAASGR